MVFLWDPNGLREERLLVLQFLQITAAMAGVLGKLFWEFALLAEREPQPIRWFPVAVAVMASVATTAWSDGFWRPSSWLAAIRLFQAGVFWIAVIDAMFGGDWTRLRRFLSAGVPGWLPPGR